MSRRQKKSLTERRRLAAARRAAAGSSGLAVVATLLSGTAAHAAQATIEVQSDAGTYAGASAQTTNLESAETLADAIAYADHNYPSTTKITFASDLSGTTGQTIYPSSTLGVTEPITIDGSGAGVTIDGGYGGVSPLYDEIFHVYESPPASWPTGASAAFNDLTITGGGRYGSGYHGPPAGAIFADAAPVTVSGSTIENSHGYGALYSDSAPLTVVDSTVTGNTGHWGGGIYINGSDAAVTVENSTVSDNTTTYQGGGVSAWNAGSVTITGSAITGNVTQNGGAGGVFAALVVTTVDIADSTVSGNIGTGGVGGIELRAFASSIENSTVADNFGSSYGGLDVYTGSSYATTLVGDTITANTTAATEYAAGGITFYGPGHGPLAIDDTIDEGNTRSGSFNSGTGVITAGSTESDVFSGMTASTPPVDGIGSSFSLIGNAGGIDVDNQALTAGTGDQLTDGTTVLNPGLSPLQTVVAGKPPVMVPQPGSPALDAGDAGDFASAVGDGFKTDELGAARPTVLGWTASLPGDGTDIGAVELGALEIPIPGVTGLSPTSGAAGTAITINGSNFWGTPTVTVGGVAARNVKLVSSTEITATVPGGLTGTVDVLVKTGSGTSTASTADQFSYPAAVTTPGPKPKPKPKTRSKTIKVGDQQLKLTIPAGSFKKNSKVKLHLTDHRLKHGTKAKVDEVVFTIGGKHKLTAHRGNTTKSLSTRGLKGHKTLQALVTLTETLGKGKHHHTKQIDRAIKLTITIG